MNCMSRRCMLLASFTSPKICPYFCVFLPSRRHISELLIYTFFSNYIFLNFFRHISSVLYIFFFMINLNHYSYELCKIYTVKLVYVLELTLCRIFSLLVSQYPSQNFNIERIFSKAASKGINSYFIIMWSLLVFPFFIAQEAALVKKKKSARYSLPPLMYYY